MSATAGGRRRASLRVVRAVAVLAVAAMALGGCGEDADDGTSADATATPGSSTPVTTAAVAPTISLAGTGDDQRTLDPPITQAVLARISYEGEQSFVVTPIDANGGTLTPLVSTIGSYRGTVPVNFERPTTIESLRVTATGSWTIAFEPVETAPTLDASEGASLDGQGDEVVAFAVDRSTRAEFSCATCDSDVVVRAYGDSPETLVNEIGSYQGVVTVPAGTTLITIETEGNSAKSPPWTITVR